MLRKTDFEVSALDQLLHLIKDHYKYSYYIYCKQKDIGLFVDIVVIDLMETDKDGKMVGIADGEGETFLEAFNDLAKNCEYLWEK